MTGFGKSNWGGGEKEITAFVVVIWLLEVPGLAPPQGPFPLTITKCELSTFKSHEPRKKPRPVHRGAILQRPSLVSMSEDSDR